VTQARYEAQFEALAASLENNEISYEEYYAKLEAWQAAHAKNEEGIEKAKYASDLQAAQGGFGAILGVMSAFGARQNDLYKSMAQSFAVAQAILSQKSAILKA